MATKRWRIAKDSNKPDIVKVFSRRGVNLEVFLNGKDLSSSESVQSLLNELQIEYSLSDSFLEVLEKNVNKAMKNNKKKVLVEESEPKMENFENIPLQEDAIENSEDSGSEDAGAEVKKNNKKKKIDS